MLHAEPGLFLFTVLGINWMKLRKWDIDFRRGWFNFMFFGM